MCGRTRRFRTRKRAKVAGNLLQISEHLECDMDVRWTWGEGRVPDYKSLQNKPECEFLTSKADNSQSRKCLGLCIADGVLDD